MTINNFQIKPGELVASWPSQFGKADIHAKQTLGNFVSPLEAKKAIVRSGEAGVVSFEPGGFRAYTIDDGAHFDHLKIGDQPQAASALPALSFVNEKGESIKDGGEILPATGTDNGKVVRVFYSYHKPYDKVVMRTPKEVTTADDVARLRELGYTVIIDRNASKEEFLTALYDPRTAGAFWFGHGSGGSFGDHEGQRIFPGDILPKGISPNLRLMVFESCQVGLQRGAWEKALPGVTLQAWDYSVTNFETSRFNLQKGPGGLADLIETRLGGEFSQKLYKPHQMYLGGLLGSQSAAGLAKSSVGQPASGLSQRSGVLKSAHQPLHYKRP